MKYLGTNFVEKIKEWVKAQIAAYIPERIEYKAQKTGDTITLVRVVNSGENIDVIKGYFPARGDGQISSHFTEVSSKYLSATNATLTELSGTNASFGGSVMFTAKDQYGRPIAGTIVNNDTVKTGTITAEAVKTANGDATHVFATDGRVADLGKKADLGDDGLVKMDQLYEYFVDEDKSTPFQRNGYLAFQGRHTNFAIGSSPTYGDYLQIGVCSDDSPSKTEMSHGISISDDFDGIKVLDTSKQSSSKFFATDGSLVDMHDSYFAWQNNRGKNGAVTIGCADSWGKDFSTEFVCGDYSVAEGCKNSCASSYSHVEGIGNSCECDGSHIGGTYCIEFDPSGHSAMWAVGIGQSESERKCAAFIGMETYHGENDYTEPKNGYLYLVDVGGFNGQSIDYTQYKSVQEVIADLTARIEALEAAKS